MGNRSDRCHKSPVSLPWLTHIPRRCLKSILQQTHFFPTPLNLIIPFTFLIIPFPITTHFLCPNHQSPLPLPSLPSPIMIYNGVIISLHGGRWRRRELIKGASLAKQTAERLFAGQFNPFGTFDTLDLEFPLNSQVEYFFPPSISTCWF